MRINNKNYKSISFTVLKDKLLSKEKKQTMRMLYMASYIEGEIVALAFKEPAIMGQPKQKREKEFLYLVKISRIYFKKLKDITLEEAQADGFDCIKDCQNTLMDLNGKKLENYVCITQWGLILHDGT